MSRKRREHNPRGLQHRSPRSSSRTQPKPSHSAAPQRQTHARASNVARGAPLHLRTQRHVLPPSRCVRVCLPSTPLTASSSPARASPATTTSPDPAQCSVPLSVYPTRAPWMPSSSISGRYFSRSVRPASLCTLRAGCSGAQATLARTHAPCRLPRRPPRPHVHARCAYYYEPEPRTVHPYAATRWLRAVTTAVIHIALYTPGGLYACLLLSVTPPPQQPLLGRRSPVSPPYTCSFHTC